LAPYVISASGGGGAGHSHDGAGTDAIVVSGDTQTTAPAAVGNFAIAIGDGAAASATQAIAIGNTTSAAGMDSVALGSGTSALGDSSVVLGVSALSNTGGDNSVVIGNTAISNSADNVVVGWDSIAGTQAVGVGAKIIAYGLQSVSLGYSSQSFGGQATALGAETQAEGDYSTAIGFGASVFDDHTIMVGTDLEAVIIPGSLTVTGVLRAPVIANRQTASYTLVLTDAGLVVEMNVASANNLTIPLNATVAYPIGTIIEILQYGAGQTTVVATGGVTIRSPGGKLKIAAQYGAASIRKIAADEWALEGDITT